MSLITKLLDVYNGVNPPDVVKDVWFNLPNTATTNDVALVLKTQGERYEVRQYVTGYYVWDGTEWIYELDAIARVSDKGSTDHHSGYNEIISSENITIESRKQMINYGGLKVDGTLNIQGDLILK